MYIEFICEHSKQLNDKSSRKSQRVFLQMSMVITSRSAEQCRTHHQKMLKTHGSLEHVVADYRRRGYPRSPGATQSGKKSPKKEEGQGGLSEAQPFRILQMGNNTVQLLIRSESILDY
jgi:hypothetical protein